MDVLIDGVSAAQYHATLLSYTISPAHVEVYSDWMRGALTPLLYGSQKKYVEIKMTLLIENDDADSVQTDISDLSGALVKSTLKFTDRQTYYDSWAAGNAEPTLVNPRTYQYDITLNAAYAYLPAVSQTLTGQTGIITALGNLPSPAVVTLTPTQDIGTVTLTGLTKRPIVVHDLHAGAPVVIDAKGTITEADYEGSITETQGVGKWLFRKYSMVAFANPDNPDVRIYPTKDTIPAGQTCRQRLIPDGSTLYQGGGYDYLGYLKTAVQIAGAANRKVRYIKDWTHGSDATPYDWWMEIQAYSNGQNVALGKPVTADFTPEFSAPGDHGGEDVDLSEVTNGNYTNQTDSGTKDGNLHYVQVDLGQAYELDFVRVWHWYTDGRTFHGTKTEVSEDGQNWYTLYDSAVNGEYQETASGHTMTVGARSVTLKLCHDDGCGIYVNGIWTYAQRWSQTAQDPATVTLNLFSGWNTIEIIWIQHYGPDGVYGITPVLGTQVDALNCAKAVHGAAGEIINKFPDTDLWSFPVLQPGENPVSIDSTACGVRVEYNPKFM